jgi:hypothetical protein
VIGHSEKDPADYKKRAEGLRMEIARRTSQLQTVVKAAMEIMKDRGDVVFKRVLENMYSRLDQARTKADKILKEPSTSEMAIKTLNAINQGLTALNRMIQNVLQQINIRIIVDAKKDTENQKVTEISQT